MDQCFAGIFIQHMPNVLDLLYVVHGYLAFLLDVNSICERLVQPCTLLFHNFTFSYCILADWLLMLVVLIGGRSFLEQKIIKSIFDAFILSLFSFIEMSTSCTQISKSQKALCSRIMFPILKWFFSPWSPANVCRSIVGGMLSCIMLA